MPSKFLKSWDSSLFERGSHVVLRRSDRGCVIPLHKELAIGTLRNAIKQADITAELFVDTYRQI